MRRSIWFRPVLIVCALIVSFGTATARESGKVSIERVVTPKGIEAWLVSEPSVPVLAMEVAFRGGGRLEPDDKMGLSIMTMGLLDEGSGDMTDQVFKAALEEKAIKLGFHADKDAVYGSLRALAPYKEEAFEMLAQALKEPRFDKPAVERVRSQIQVALARNAAEPSYLSRTTWFAEALKGHPYARPGLGTKETVQAITRADLKAFHKSQIGRDRMVVSVVGPISAEELAVLLDKNFGDLPEVGAAPEPTAFEFHPAGEPIVVDRDIPQSVVTFGAPGLMPSDEEFMPALVMNYVLGGGGFASRLMEEIREKRGLTYGIYTSLAIYDAGGLFRGSFSTDNGAFPEAYSVLQDEIARMAAGGVTAEELTNAKTYLTGSFALRFDTNEGIAGQLLSYQLNGFGIDYINKRNSLIEAVTAEEISQVAQELLKEDKFLYVVVGRPKADSSTN